jgi:hypothetical protein
MTFLTNQLDWAASNVADLYHCRWQVDVFFKQIKRTLQLADILRHNQNAVSWAGLDRAVALRSAALPRLAALLGGELLAPLHPLAHHDVDGTRPHHPAPTLWDGRPRATPHLRPPREPLFCPACSAS